MPRSMMCLLMFALCTQSPAQPAPKGGVVKSFSYDQPDPRTVPLPPSIRAFLEHDSFVIDRMTGQDPAISALPDDWVNCYRVSLGPAHESDFVIQANNQLGGANVTPFWVFRMIAGQPKLVLFAGGLSLEIKSQRFNGLREIWTYSVTMQHSNTDIYRFSGAQYLHTGEQHPPI